MLVVMMVIAICPGAKLILLSAVVIHVMVMYFVIVDRRLYTSNVAAIGLCVLCNRPKNVALPTRVLRNDDPIGVPLTRSCIVHATNKKLFDIAAG